MIGLPRPDRVFGPLIANYAAHRPAVRKVKAYLPAPLPSPHRIATGIGAGRVVLGGTFLVAPVLSVRVLGMDTASAKRVTYLARMTAGRDIVLGLGTLAAGDGPACVPWLLAGAAADAVDAVVIAGALRGGRTKGALAAGIAAGAALTAGVAVAAAVSLRQAGRQ